MNYDRIIIELLDRVSVLEEKILKLEELIAQNNVNVINNDDNNIVKSRDKTRYFFDGHLCLKNRLVWRVVKKYIEDNKNINFEELQRIFTDNLQGSFGVIRKKNSVDKNSMMVLKILKMVKKLKFYC